MKKRRTLIFLIGKSGSGKDTAADYLCTRYGFRKVASYTTRPIRDGEMNGREHTFVTWGAVANSPETWLSHRGLHLLAKTLYGGHHYFTAKEQLTHEIDAGRRKRNEVTIHRDIEHGILHETRLVALPPNTSIIYIIDEHGLMDMLSDAGNLAWLNDNFDYEVWNIIRKNTDVESERTKRDDGRTELPSSAYQHVIHNYYDLDWLYSHLDAVMHGR